VLTSGRVSVVTKALLVGSILGVSTGIGCTLDASLKHRCETSADCLAGRVCVRSVCQDPSSDAPRPNYMFVTSHKFPPRFQPLGVADQKCNDAAADAGLPGDYRAWLSTSAIYARDRLAGARGWVRPDGAPFADTVDDITSGRILTPPLLDEQGHEVLGTPEMPEKIPTGTNAFGLVNPGINCHDWANDEVSTASGGYTVGTTVLWTDGDGVNCGAPTRIYCFGVDQAFALTPATPSGKRAFLSAAFTVSGGVAAIDAHCAADAASAGLSGTFLALVATTMQSAASRFDDSPGATWIRLDGVPLNSAGSDLFDGLLQAPLNLTIDGQYVANEAVVTGAAGPRALASGTNENCADWLDPFALTTVGTPSRVDSWFSGNGMACNYPARVYCLEH